MVERLGVRGFFWGADRVFEEEGERVVFESGS